MGFIKQLFSTKDEKERKQKHIKSALQYSAFTSKERSMINGVVAISNLTASDIMVPRVDVTRVQLTVTKKELTNLLKTSLYSRFPVYGDNIDDIRGVLHIRDIFNLLIGSEKDFQIKKCLQDPIFVPESRPGLDILSDLQKEHKQMVIVMDEYGGFSGIITMEDILEEVIGDVRDESDDKKEIIITLGDLMYSIDARTDLEEINEKIKLNLSDDKADSIGGYLINLFGYIPKKGERIDHEGISFKVTAKRGNSITRITMEISPQLAKAIEEQNLYIEE